MKSHNLHEQSLHQNPEFAKRLVACFPDVITVHDTEGRYTYVSPRVEEVLGYKPEEYAGTALEERKHPEDREKVTEFFRNLISGSVSSGTLEYRTRHKDGSWRSFRVSANSLTDQNGKIIGVIASSRDITDAKRVEQQLLQVEKLTAIAEMVSGVAHELNNPLTAILGVAELLRQRTTDVSTARQLGIIEEQARKAAELVQGLLSISRPPRRKNERVLLSTVASRAIELKRSALAQANISVQCGRLEDLPPIEGDAQQITHVFVNLLANAEQAISSVRSGGHVSISARRRGKQIEILVEDDGPGVPEDLRARIFDPFFTTRRTAGGTGLGLSLCTVILREHQGTIEAESPPAGGARFRILLPMANVAAGTDSSSAAGQGIAGCSILLVEDEEGIREIIEESLRARGARIESVSAGEGAWERLRSHSYNLCLCDFNLGDISGLDLFRRTSQLSNQPPHFLFITGEILDESLLSDLERKGARALQKPFQISQLVAAIEASLSAAHGGAR